MNMEQFAKDLKSTGNHGYRKFMHKKYGKLYVAVVRIGRRVRITRFFFKSATKALAYGARVLARYERMFGGER